MSLFVNFLISFLFFLFFVFVWNWFKSTVDCDKDESEYEVRSVGRQSPPFVRWSFFSNQINTVQNIANVLGLNNRMPKTYMVLIL